MTQWRVSPRRGGRSAEAKASCKEVLVARRFFGLVLALMMIGVPLLASCSTESSTSSTSSTSATSTKPDGSLAIAVNFRMGGLDPQLNTPNTLQTAALAMFDTLVMMDSNAEVKPGIAEKWEISPDGTTHTFYIRKGVKFHDGSDLTGGDVKFSIERILNPKATHQDATTWRAMIDGVDLKDDYTVAIRLKKPLFELLVGFGDYSGSTAVVPKKYIEEKGDDYFATHPLGSGPWKFVKWDPGNRLELEAVLQPQDWRAVPKFKNVTLLNVAEESTKVAMLKTGELDIADVSTDSVSALKASGLRIIPHDGGAQFVAYAYYDLEHPESYALGNIKVRKALSLATNRKEMGDKLYSGYAEPSTLFYVRPTAYFWDPNQLKPDPYDLEGAKKLIAEAGYPNGFPVKIWDSGAGGILSTFAQALAGYWRKVGVNVSLETIDQAALMKLSNPKVLPQMYDTFRIVVSGGGVFHFEKFVIPYHSKKGSLHNFNNLQLDELIDKVPLTMDPAEKKKLALQAAVMAKNEYNDLSILDMQTLFAVSPKVGELTPIKGMTGLAARLEAITHAK